MSLFISEAFFVGLKEALKLTAVWVVFYALLNGRGLNEKGLNETGRAGLMRPFYIGLSLTAVLFSVSFVASPSPEARGFVTALTGYTFFIFFLLSVGAIYQSTGTELLPGLFRRAVPRLPLVVGIIGLTVFYFSPDIIGSSLYLRELSAMKADAMGVYLSAIAGFVLPASALGSVSVRRRLAGPKGLIGPYFDVPQFLLFLSIVKLLGGGARGYAEFSLIPMVQRGLMKFFHDVVHQTFVFLMVPDHPMLKITAWNFIGILFGSNIAMAAALALLLVPPLVFLYRSLYSPLTVGEAQGMTGAEKRILKVALRSDRRRKAAPVAFFALFIFVLWYGTAGERASELYNPGAKPVVSDKGQIIVPLTDPTMDLFDGRLHKFALVEAGQTIKFLIIKKPDGRLAVCLDACEICPPDGYGQTEGHVVCIYCMTPIPIKTLGSIGGCNPIPLATDISESDIRISVGELLLKWKEVITGTSKEGLR